MNRKIMNLTEISDLRNISIDYLTTEYEYRAIKGVHFTRVYSAPNVVYYGKGEFIGSFVFDRNKLKRIILIPIIPGVKAPNYPSEEYQNIKKEYCVSILEDIYGNESASNAVGTYWERENMIIGCCAMLEGKDLYTGGDIVISLR